MARPTIFTEELGDQICAQVMAGKPLVRICAEEDMPHPATVYRWFREHQKFCDNYARAKEDQADYFVEDILQIADEASTENVQVARLRVDTRKWAASKYKPKKYGDRLVTELKNPDGESFRTESKDLTKQILASLPQEQLEELSIEPAQETSD